MNLLQIDFPDIPIGLKVKSYRGTHGKVVKKIAEVPGSGVRYDTVVIDWDNGRQSTQFHMLLDCVEVLE